MRVLFVTSKPVFPLADGGNIASLALLKNLLQLGFNVKNLTLETEKHPFDAASFPAQLRDIITPRAVFADTAIRAKDALLSFFRKGSYNVSRFYVPAFEKAIAGELRDGNYGLVVLESVYVLPYLRVVRKHFSGKVIVRTHNVEHRIWERLALEEKNLLRRMFLKKLARDLKHYELACLPLTDGIACISDDDLQQLEKLGVRVPMRTIPVSMELSRSADFDFGTAQAGKNDFFFLGAMNWQPNIEAVNYLLKEVFPLILEKIPDAMLHLAGSYMPDSLLKLEQRNVVVHGRVDSVADFMAAHGILLVPMRSGSGIRIKILEALSNGIPVISTTVGLEGIPVVNGVHGLQCDSARDLADAALRLSSDHALAASLGRNGRAMVLSTYSPQNVSSRLLEFIRSI